MSEYREVMWYSGSGGGVRSWRLYGLSKVHLWDGRPHSHTLCGVAVPLPSKRCYPDPLDDRCKRCAKRVEG